MTPVTVNYVNDPKLRITEMSWERINLLLTIESDHDEELVICMTRIVFPTDEVPNFDEDDDNEQETVLTGNLIKEIPLEPYKREGNKYYFLLNLSAMDGSSFLENGRWRITTWVTGSDALHICTISHEAAYKLPEMCRIFSYGRGKYSYNVYFATFCNDSTNIVPVMNSRFMIENPKWRDRFAVSERRTLNGKFRCVLKRVKLSMIQSAYDFYSHTRRPGKKNILFMSETKPYIWGNLKFIDQRIKERGLDKEFGISYTFRQAVGRNSSAGSWLKTVRKLAANDYIFVDDFVPIFNFLKLTDDTKLIQVWHAGVGFKSVGYSRFGGKSSPHPEYNCHRRYDYVITGSESLVEVYSEVFGLPRENFLPLGMARLDGFLDEDVIKSKTEEFYAAHPECKGKKLILFSPTFRGSGQKKAHYDYSQLDIDRIYEFCGDEYIWAFKMHPFTHNKPKIPEEYGDRIIDLTQEKNINDLYYVTDIMITDYSSAYYEFSLMERPILFFTYDREVYEIVRGVHKSIKETAPGKVCDTFDELMTALETKDYELDKTLKFREENFSNYDGHAADRIIDQILLGKEPESPESSK